LKITLNGKAVEISEEMSLKDFIEARSLRREGVIAELNEKVVARDEWGSALLAEGDCLELVSLVGGG